MPKALVLSQLPNTHQQTNLLTVAVKDLGLQGEAQIVADSVLPAYVLHAQSSLHKALIRELAGQLVTVATLL